MGAVRNRLTKRARSRRRRFAIEDELFEFEPGSSFDWIEPRVAPALLSAVGRYRGVLALVAPHY
jgi:hypothetical protein